MFKFSPLKLAGVTLVEPRQFSDNRGLFWETYSELKFFDAGLDARFVQDNQSFSKSTGTVRGLHAQAPPFAQAKLVRVVRGSIIDVAVDIRKDSATYGHWIAERLSARAANQLYIPRGYLHGFVTLEDNVEVVYKVDSVYSKESELSVAWNDPQLAIDWGIVPGSVSVSEKDAAAPNFKDFTSPY